MLSGKKLGKEKVTWSLLYIIFVVWLKMFQLSSFYGNKLREFQKDFEMFCICSET